MENDNLVIIGITGLPSSGKGVFASVAIKKNFKELVMGDVIRTEVRKRNLPLTRDNSNKIMIKLREERGDTAVASVTLDWIEEEINKGHNKILIDGIRSLAEVNLFREVYPEVKIVAIHADPKTRYYRAKERKRRDDAYSWESFKERDELELEVGLGDVIALSDYMVSSVDSLEAVKVRYNNIIEDILTEQKAINVLR